MTLDSRCRSCNSDLPDEATPQFDRLPGAAETASATQLRRVPLAALRSTHARVLERTYGAHSIGRALRTLREDLCYSRLDLALLANVDDKYLARIEHGQCNVSVWKLAPILFALGFSLSKFFALLEICNEADAETWFRPCPPDDPSRRTVYHVLQDAPAGTD